MMRLPLIAEINHARRSEPEQLLAVAQQLAADVVALAKLPLAGIIIGRALYEGSIDLSEALRVIWKSA